MKVDTLVVFGSTKGLEGSLFEILLTVNTFNPKRLFIFYENSFLRLSSFAIPSENWLPEGSSILVKAFATTPEGYDIANALTRLDPSRDFCFLICNGIDARWAMTIANCINDYDLEERLIAFDKKKKVFLVARKNEIPYRIYPLEGIDKTHKEILGILGDTFLMALKQVEFTPVFSFGLGKPSVVEEENEKLCYKIPLFRKDALLKKEKVASLDLWIQNLRFYSRFKVNQELPSGKTLSPCEQSQIKNVLDIIVS